MTVLVCSKTGSVGRGICSGKLQSFSDYSVFSDPRPVGPLAEPLFRAPVRIRSKKRSWTGKELDRMKKEGHVAHVCSGIAVVLPQVSIVVRQVRRSSGN